MSCNKKRKEPPEVNDNGENKETDFETPSKKIRMRTEHSTKTKRNLQKLKPLNPPTTPKSPVRNFLKKFNFRKTKLRSPEVQS